MTLSAFLFCSVLCVTGCKQDDPEPVNEEEVITTVEVVLSPQGGGIPVTLRFYDADGELGNITPLISVSGSLKASTNYEARISLRNETVTPPLDISAEVEEESGEHIFCFNAVGGIVITYLDEDAEGRPIGLETLWETSGPGVAEVTVSLRHQAGTKTGECPGAGDTDVEVTFDLTVD